MATYHVQHRFGFIGDADDTDKIVIDCQDAAVYSCVGAFQVAEDINKGLGESDRQAQPVMLTSTGKVRRLTRRAH